MKEFTFHYGRGTKSFSLDESKIIKEIRMPETPVMEDIPKGVLEAIYNPIVTNLAENQCSVFCFTMSQALPFKKKCEKYIVLPRISRDSNISFLDDQAVFMVFIEILMNRIATLLSK